MTKSAYTAPTRRPEGLEMNITASTVKRVNPPDSGYELHWDDKLKGFGLRVTKTGAVSFVAEGRVRGRSRRVTLGRLGTITADQARQRAKTMLGKMSDGIDPNAEKAEQRATSVTLAELAQNYKENRRTSKGLPLKDSTKADIDKHLSRTFSDWRKKPVAEIGREMVKRRYLEACKRSTAQANQAMRVLSALFNYGREQYRKPDGSPLLADNPVKVLRASSILRAIPKRKNHIPPERIGEWWTVVQARRADPALTPVSKTTMDLIALLALTGLRIGEGAALKWSDVDLDDASIRLADPKNREAVTLPLSDLAVGILEARKSRHEYVFPARSGKGHVTEVRGQLAALKNETGIEVTAHDLRRTFRAVAGQLGIELWRCKALMNHKQNQDVTLAHYTDLSDVRNLKPEADRIAEFFEDQRRVFDADNVVDLSERRA